MDNTIAQGEVTYTFASLLPALPFSGDGSLVFPRPRQVTLVPYRSNPLSNTFAKPDTEILANGGPIRSVTINRDGSVKASNSAGTISVAAEKRPELVPFNQTPMPLAGAEMITAGEVPSKLDAIIEQFKSDTASIRQQSGEAGRTGPSDFIQPYHPKNGKCNAACWWVFKLQAEANDLKAQVAAGAGGNIAATGGKSTRTVGKNAAGLPQQEFSILPNVSGINLTLAVVGVFLFVAAISIAMAVKHRRKP